MNNKHVEYRRIVDGADKAVLLIHGILSTPNHFRHLLPLIPEDYSVIAMVTAGHCSHMSDFSTGRQCFYMACIASALHLRIYFLHNLYVFLRRQQF